MSKERRVLSIDTAISYSGEVLPICWRAISRLIPRSRSRFAAKQSCSRSTPKNRCPVPMNLCESFSASSAAYARMRWHSLLSGKSTEVETLSELQCALLLGYGSTQGPRANARRYGREICLRVANPARGVPTRWNGTRIGLLHTAQRRSCASLFPYIVQT